MFKILFGKDLQKEIKRKEKRGRKPPWNQAVAQAPTGIQLPRPSRSGPERGQPGAPLLSLSLSDRAGPPVSGRKGKS